MWEFILSLSGWSSEACRSLFQRSSDTKAVAVPQEAGWVDLHKWDDDHPRHSHAALTWFSSLVEEKCAISMAQAFCSFLYIYIYAFSTAISFREAGDSLVCVEPCIYSDSLCSHCYPAKLICCQTASGSRGLKHMKSLLTRSNRWTFCDSLQNLLGLHKIEEACCLTYMVVGQNQGPIPW